MSQLYIQQTKGMSPLLNLLKQEGWQAVDMHYHSKYSVDGLATVKQVLSRCKKNGVGTSFTDHNHIKGSIEAWKKGVFVVPGIELTCHNGVHVLLHFSRIKEYKLFYEKEMKKRVAKNPWFLDADYKKMINVASKYDCLITAPHPFGPGVCGIKKQRVDASTLKKIHAIEVLNGTGQGSMNTKAAAWARKIKKGFTGGPDGHCINEHGTVLTLCKASTVEGFLEEIRKKKSIVIGKEERLLADAIYQAEKFVREERKAPNLGQMWKDRGLHEWDILQKKGHDFFHHFHVHHKEVSKKKLEKHKHTTHLSKRT